MSSQDMIPVALYLFKRLHELGVRGVHGVPGDFNLIMLDLIPDAGMYWVGNCNELNSAYAADGYARIKGISALITTFGVGELSALAGVAGSYSEHVPVVHIVGIPNTAAQRSGLLLHHTLGNGNFTVFQEMSKNISVATTVLSDPHHAAAEIDRVLTACWVHARPVYIGLPTDIVLQKVPASSLQTPLALSLPPNDPETENEVVADVSKLIYESENTIILADACAIRHRVLPELHELIEKTNLPTIVSPMGKGAVNEELAAYSGVYVGDVSDEAVSRLVDDAQLILYVGGLQSDFNSGGFTYRISRRNTVEFHSDHTKVRYAEFPGIRMGPVLRKLLGTLDYSRIKTHPTVELSNVIPRHVKESGSEEITHAWLWPRVGQWLREEDVVITETGTSNFGIWETRFPKGVTAISQVLWGSIGYAVGALQGAALACKESFPHRRVILFVINNKGYTIERMIHGADAVYNDIQPWDHTALLKVLGAEKENSASHRVNSRAVLEKLFDDEQFSSAPHIQLVEVFMPKMDAPRALFKVGEMTAKLNSSLKSGA